MLGANRFSGPPGRNVIHHRPGPPRSGASKIPMCARRLGLSMAHHFHFPYGLLITRKYRFKPGLYTRFGRKHPLGSVNTGLRDSKRPHAARRDLQTRQKTRAPPGRGSRRPGPAPTPGGDSPRTHWARPGKIIRIIIGGGLVVSARVHPERISELANPSPPTPRFGRYPWKPSSLPPFPWGRQASSDS